MVEGGPEGQGKKAWLGEERLPLLRNTSLRLVVRPLRPRRRSPGHLLRERSLEVVGEVLLRRGHPPSPLRKTPRKKNVVAAVVVVAIPGA